MLKRQDIRIRDPYILTDKEKGCYYMYGTTALLPDSLAAKDSFVVYKTYDLENFEDPKTVFCGADIGFWANRDFWAPEVHRYNGKYYLFGSCKADGKCRATHIFVCDTPDGTFVPLSETPPTPSDWECLDGTLWVENGIPYMVFCHEWIQVKNGEMCAMPLKEDLSAPVGEPVLLFRATDEPAIAEGKPADANFITDGPFLYREGDKLKMIWSSHTYLKQYVVLEAESESGSVLGPWKQKGSRFDFDGGHAMLFESLEGKRMISLHAPNKKNLERACFFKY